MRALTLGLCLGWLACSERIELFPGKVCLDAGMPNSQCCVGQLDPAGVLQPCGCLALCESDADCPAGRCDAAVALCTQSAGSCATAADCPTANRPARGWVCKATPGG